MSTTDTLAGTEPGADADPTSGDYPEKNMPTAKWIDLGGIRTRYYDAGSGEPVVFIYGGNFGTADSAPSAAAWNLNFMPIARQFRAIAFDKLGQGYTDNPLRDEDYTMAAVIRHAADFIRALGLPPVHVVGHSRGGFAATRLTLDYPDLVRSLTIVNSGTLMPAASTNEVVLSGCPHPSYTRDSARWIYQGYCYRPETVDDEWVESVFRVLCSPKYRESVRKMVDEQLGSRLFLPELARQKRETLAWIEEGRLQRPVQMFWGYNDATAKIEGGLKVYEMIARRQRRAVLHVINESGHFPYREHPAQFNALLARFVADYAA